MSSKNQIEYTLQPEIKFANELAYIRRLVAQNGPNPEDYETLNSWYDKIGKMRKLGTISEEETDFLRATFGEVYLFMRLTI